MALNRTFQRCLGHADIHHAIGQWASELVIYLENDLLHSQCEEGDRHCLWTSDALCHLGILLEGVLSPDTQWGSHHLDVGFRPTALDQNYDPK